MLSPEVTEVRGQKVGEFNTRLFDRLMSFDRVYVFGQAKSHCVLSTLMDLRQHIERDGSLEDGPHRHPRGRDEPGARASAGSAAADALDFPRVADAAVRELQQAGMRVARTTDPLDV